MDASSGHHETEDERVRPSPLGGHRSVSVFERETVDTVSGVRETFAKVIELKCPGSKAVSAVSEALGIHRKLAWQVIKVAYSDDPFVAAKHMPSAKSTRVFAQAARERGVDESLVAQIDRSSERFGALMRTHASDKAEFEMLLESLCADEEQNDDQKWRQLSYEGNSFTWGVHCKTQLSMMVMSPSRDQDRHFDMAQIRGIIGFRLTRPNVRWVVNQSIAVDDEKRPESGMYREALDPEGARAFDGAPVMPGYCSDPVPALQRTETSDGAMQDEFVSGEIGLMGERTLVTGEILRNIAPTHATAHDKTAHFGSAVRTPTEMLHFDLFVRAGLFGNVERELCVFSDIASGVAFAASDELMVRESIQRMGRGISSTHSPDVPGYNALARHVFDRLEIDPDQYELYRVRIPYPPFPSSVMLRHALLPQSEIAPLE